MARFWFNSEAIKKLLNENGRRVLMRAGAFVRRTAMGYLRSAPRGVTAKPGRPPRSHFGLLRDLIVFEWDDEERQVVIGPLLLKRTLGGNTVPHLLEFSGKMPSRAWQRRRLAKTLKTTKEKIRRNWQYRAFPFMAPALKKNLPKIVKMFEGALIGPAAENVSIGPGGTSGS